jgi:dihydrofolate reductase
MIVAAIAAIDKNLAIGKDNDVPWHLPDDLKYFKRKTLNHHIIMGRKTFESIGYKPLPRRTNIVVTRNPFFVATNCLVVGSVEEGLNIAREHGEEEAFILGGGDIYRLSLPYLDRIYLTEIDAEVEGAEVFFPAFDSTKWKLVSSEPHPADSQHEFSFSFNVYERVSLGNDG